MKPNTLLRKILNWYGPGPMIDEPLSIEKDGSVYYYHADGLGSVTVLTDSSQQIAERYVYDSFGNFTTVMEEVKNTFRFTGREWDEETGLYYYRARYYDPEVGRFISKDPIGFAGGDWNVYNYVGANAVNWADPWGLDSLLFNGERLFWINDYGSIIKSYSSISGPFGKGRLPEGVYIGENLRKRTAKGMVCPSGGWSLDINPTFDTDRTALRIHPDQAPPVGTLGCIGVNCVVSEQLYKDLQNYFGIKSVINYSIYLEVNYSFMK